MEYWVEPDDRPAIYAALLPEMRDAAWRLGYSLAVHGSMRRDMDVVAIPWIAAAAPAELLVDAIYQAVGGHDAYRPYPPSVKPHGRRAWSIHLSRCVHMYVDLSVMPRCE